MTLEAYSNVLAAICIWREARGSSPLAQLGVYWTIINRTRDPKKRWPHTIAGVVLQPLQFSSFNTHDPNAVKFPAPDDLVFKQCCEIVDAPGPNDPTNGANSYHSIPDGQPLPKWAVPEKITAHLGPFKFYRL